MSETLRIGINGLGRIGRTVLRAAAQRLADPEWKGVARPGPAIEVVAANDLIPADRLAYLVEHDSVHRWPRMEASVTERGVRAGPFDLTLSRHADPSSIGWRNLGVDVVLECTGRFSKRPEVAAHLEQVDRVILGRPGEGDEMVVLGANDERLMGDPKVLSAASCTTHATAPVLSVLHRAFGVRWCLLGTVHAYTAGQSLVDGATPHDDWRRGRAAAYNIVPTTTHATKALTVVLPELAGKVDGNSVRVPVPEGSLWELTLTLDGSPSLERVIDVLRDAAQSPQLRRIIEVVDKPLVSSDIVGEPVSSIVDVGASRSSGPLIKLVGWYDNEAGYAARLLDLAVEVSRRGGA